jgi:hypothetical protein
MKSKSIFHFKFITGYYFLFRSPPFIGKCIFQFIPVQKFLRGSDNRINLRQINFPNPDQIIPDLLLFILKLKMIWKMLPLATTAYPEMDTSGFNPVR